MPDCIFCDEKKISKEHVWGNWLTKEPFYPVDNEVPKSAHYEDRNDKNGSVIVEKGFFHGGEHPLRKTSKVVCSNCNNKWMSQIEQSMKRCFHKILISGDQLVNEIDANSIVNWIYLKACIHERAIKVFVPEEIYNIKGLREQYEEKILCLRNKKYKKFYNAKAIEDNYRFFVGRASGEVIGAHNYLPLGDVRIYEDGEIDVSNIRNAAVIAMGHLNAVVTNDYDLAKFLKANFPELTEIKKEEVATIPNLIMHAHNFDERIIDYINNRDKRELRYNRE